MNYTDKDILNNIASLKSVLDGYRPFPEHVVKQLRDYYRIGLSYTSKGENTVNVSLFSLIPFDCFRDGSGLNALRIKNCLSEVSFFNLAGSPETDC